MHTKKKFSKISFALIVSFILLLLICTLSFLWTKQDKAIGDQPSNDPTPTVNYINDSEKGKKTGHVYNLATQYYTNELRMTTDKITGFSCSNNELELVGYNKAGKYSSKYWNHTGKDPWNDNGGLEKYKSGNDYFDAKDREWLVLNKDVVSYAFAPNENKTIGTVDGQTNLATVNFKDVGKVEIAQDQFVNLDADLTIHSIVLTNSENKEKKIFDGDTDGLYPLVSIRNYNMSDVLKENNKTIYNLPQIAGPISFTTENHVYNGTFRPKVEIDYSLTLYNSNDHSKPFEYPVYSMYTDLDVVSSNSTHPESITPAAGENNVSFVGKFPAKSDNDIRIGDWYQHVRPGRSTFTEDKNYTLGNTGGFPDSLVKAGITLTSEAGTYRAIWRGGGCETGITMAPLGFPHVFKSDQYDLVEQKDFASETPKDNEKITFDLESYLGRWSEDTFLAYENLDFTDTLPQGLTLPNGQDDIDFGYKVYDKEGALLQDFISFKNDAADTAAYKGPKDPSGNGYIDKFEFDPEIGAIRLRIDKNFLKYDNETNMKTRYNGKTLCLRINSMIKDVTAGTESVYPEDNIYSYKHNVYKDKYKGQKALKFTNKGTVWYDSLTENYYDGTPQESNGVDAYSPYYSKEHEFYECDKDGNPVLDKDGNPVPLREDVTKAIFDKNKDSLEQTRKYEYKLGKTVSPDEFVEDGKRVFLPYKGFDEVWCFKKWDNESQTCTKDTLVKGDSMLNRSMVFKGYWFKVNNPDNKEWNVEGTHTADSRPVKVGDTIDYKISATNSIFTANTITVEDTLSKGLTFNESSIKVTKNGDTEVPKTEFTYEIKHENDNTLVIYNFSNIEYGDQIVITYNATVNDSAEQVIDFPFVSNTAEVKIDEFSKTIINPVMFKTYGEKEDNVIADSSPVRVDDIIKYRVYWASYTDQDAAQITVTDTMSKGLSYDHMVIGNPVPRVEGNKLTWTLTGDEYCKAGKHGYFEIYAKVTEEALTVKTVSNEYEVKVDDTPAVKPNPVENPVVAKKYDAEVSEEQINNDSPVKFGDTIAYQLDWAAYQYEDAEKIVLEDTLSEGLTYDNTTTEGFVPEITKQADGTTLVKYTLYNKKAGEQGSICFTAKVNKDAVAKRIVENNYTLKIQGKPDIKLAPLDNPVVAKIYNPDDAQATISDDKPVKLDDVIGYKINWANNYTTPTDKITISDTLSRGLEYVADSASLTPKTIETDIESGITKITWELENQPAKASGTISYRARVTDKAIRNIPDKVVNTAQITIDGGRTIDLDPLTNPVVAKKYDESDKEASCTAKGPVCLDSIIAYELNWASYETESAEKIVLTDTLSKGLKYVRTTTADAPEPIIEEHKDGTTTITYTLGETPAASTGKICFEAQVTQTALDELISKDYYLVQNDYTLTIGEKPDIKLNPLKNPVVYKGYGKAEEGVVSDSSPVRVGDIISYKLYWSALPGEKADKIEILDQLSKGLEYIGVEEGTPEPTYVLKDTGDIVWIFENDDEHCQADAHGIFEFKARVTEDAPLTPKEDVVNEYSMHVFDGTWCDPKPLTNHVVYKTYDEEADGVNDDNPVKVGDEICYKIKWANNMDTKAKVKLTDELKFGLEYVEGSSSPSEPSTIDKRHLEWDLGEQEPGASGVFTYKALVTKDAVIDLPYVVDNKYVLNIDEGRTIELDPLINPVVDKQYNPDDPEANIHSDVEVKVGDVIGYKICWANRSKTDGTVTVKDVLSKGLEFDASSVKGTDIRPNVDKQIDGSTIITWTFKDMPAGSMGAFTYRAKVTKDAMTIEPGKVVNTASIIVDEGRTIELDPLINPTPANPVAETGDNLIWIISLLALIFGGCLVQIIRTKTKRQ